MDYIGTTVVGSTTSYNYTSRLPKNGTVALCVASKKQKVFFWPKAWLHGGKCTARDRVRFLELCWWVMDGCEALQTKSSQLLR